MNPPDVPIAPVGSSVGSSDPLANLQNVVDAAKEAAQIAGSPTGTPQEQFNTQFGSPVTPPVAEQQPTPDLMAQALSGLGSEPPVESPAQQDQPVVAEAPVPEPEKTPAQRWEELSGEVKAFLEEVTQEKVTA